MWAVAELEPDWRVIDIGAGLGDFTVFAAKHCPKGVVHAYEPLAESLNLLRRNLELNSIENVQFYNLAVAAEAGLLVQEDAEREAVSRRFIAGEPGKGAVTAVSLDRVLDKLPDGVCDFMKMDCEGCEFDLLLNSSPQTLSRIKRISMEYHDEATSITGAELAIRLQSLGFAVRIKENPVHPYLGFLYAEHKRLD